MHKIDKEFTLKYMSILKKFSFLIVRNQAFFSTKNKTIFNFFSQLNSQLKHFSSTRNLFENNIYISPNLMFAYKNKAFPNKTLNVTLGGELIIKSGTICRQSLCLYIMLEKENDEDILPDYCDFNDSNLGYHILRKFHFDFDSLNDDKTKPKYHLQYGGKFNSKHLEIAGKPINYNLFSTLDTPRLPHQPYDIIMLIDFIMREFTSDNYIDLFDKEWYNILVECEKLWLIPYYNSILKRLNSSTRSEPLHYIS